MSSETYLGETPIDVKDTNPPVRAGDIVRVTGTRTGINGKIGRVIYVNDFDAVARVRVTRHGGYSPVRIVDLEHLVLPPITTAKIDSGVRGEDRFRSFDMDGVRSLLTTAARALIPTEASDVHVGRMMETLQSGRPVEVIFGTHRVRISPMVSQDHIDALNC